MTRRNAKTLALSMLAGFSLAVPSIGAVQSAPPSRSTLVSVPLCASGRNTMRPLKSSLNRSRITFTSTSGSS